MSDFFWPCELCGDRHHWTMIACPEYLEEPDEVLGSNTLTQVQFSQLLEDIQKQERDVRKQGQSEYARDISNCHANFDRIAAQLDLTPEQVLWVYLAKHLDGLASWINGHRSQREDVRGRLLDARLYLALLWGMVERGDP